MGRVLSFVLLLLVIKIFFPILTESVLELLSTMIAVIQQGLDLILSGLPAQGNGFM